jgi:hypothetical protein
MEIRDAFLSDHSEQADNGQAMFTDTCNSCNWPYWHASPVDGRQKSSAHNCLSYKASRPSFFKGTFQNQFN